MNKETTRHSNMLVIDGIGTLILGHPNVGKSELTLALIDRGHQIVSDDAVLFKRENNHLIGHSPKSIAGFMQIDYVGLFNLNKIFGPQTCCPEHRIDIAITLEEPNTFEKPLELLEPIQSELNILDIFVPNFHLPATPGRYLPLLIEVIVKNYKLHKAGYNPYSALKKQTGKSQCNEND